MLKHNLALIAGSLVLFGSTLAVAAIDFDSTPDPNEDRQIRRKSGDMFVYYNGRGYRSLSTRRGSLGNRTFRGGGLHGGK